MGPRFVPSFESAPLTLRGASGQWRTSAGQELRHTRRESLRKRPVAIFQEAPGPRPDAPSLRSSDVPIPPRCYRAQPESFLMEAVSKLLPQRSEMWRLERTLAPVTPDFAVNLPQGKFVFALLAGLRADGGENFLFRRDGVEKVL